MFRSALLAGVALSCLASVAHAATLDAPSRVTEATIYADRALVARSAKIHVPAGASTLNLSGVPADIIEASLRVQGSATAPVKIGTVEVKREYLTEAANQAERDKNTQLEAKQDEKTLLQGEINAVQTKQDFIKRLMADGAETHPATGPAKIDFTPEKWAQAWNALQTGMNESQKDIALKTIAMRKLDASIAALQAELNQLRSSAAKERRTARVNIDSSAETDLNLTITYQTASANWHPVYDARLDTNSGKLDLEQYGDVTQFTGEDWSNVALTLSTARPATGSEMPRLTEWFVHILAPVMQRAAGVMSYLAESSRSNLAAPAMKMEAMEMDAAAPAAAPVQAEQTTAEAQTTEYSAEFKVPGAVDLKSARDFTKLFIGNVPMKAELMAQTAPRLAPQAYLFAKATHTQSYPLLPGQVAKFRDGAFIGNAALPLIRPDEETRFSFGTDDRIKVDYKRLKDKRENPALVIMGDGKVERQYQTKIQNLHKEPITIALFDQIPIASDGDVKVALLDDQTTTGYAKDPDSRQGVMVWTYTYQPREEKTFTLGFRVDYPKGKTLEGL